MPGLDDYSENDDSVSETSLISPINRIDDDSNRSSRNYITNQPTTNQLTINHSNTNQHRIHYENAKVCFPSMQDPFYCIISSIRDGFNIWVESKRSKKQWQLDVIDTDLVKYASDPTGIPKIYIIAKYLTNAFARIEKSSSVDAKYEIDNKNEYINLYLTISHYILDEPWQMYFNFKLLPKEINDTIKLESRLRDTNEEVNELKSQLIELKELLASTLDLVKQNKPHYLSINGNDHGTVPRFTNGETPSNKVYFNGTGHVINSPTHFDVSVDRSEIQGIYTYYSTLY
jgi:hypothetical protein